jgi:hypothetical protein
MSFKQSFSYPGHNTIPLPQSNVNILTGSHPHLPNVEYHCNFNHALCSYIPSNSAAPTIAALNSHINGLIQRKPIERKKVTSVVSEALHMIFITSLLGEFNTLERVAIQSSSVEGLPTPDIEHLRIRSLGLHATTLSTNKNLASQYLTSYNVLLLPHEEEYLNIFKSQYSPVDGITYFSRPYLCHHTTDNPPRVCTYAHFPRLPGNRWITDLNHYWIHISPYDIYILIIFVVNFWNNSPNAEFIDLYEVLDDALTTDHFIETRNNGLIDDAKNITPLGVLHQFLKNCDVPTDNGSSCRYLNYRQIEFLMRLVPLPIQNLYANWPLPMRRPRAAAVIGPENTDIATTAILNNQSNLREFFPAGIINTPHQIAWKLTGLTPDQADLLQSAHFVSRTVTQNQTRTMKYRKMNLAEFITSVLPPDLFCPSPITAGSPNRSAAIHTTNFDFLFQFYPNNLPTSISLSYLAMLRLFPLCTQAYTRDNINGQRPYTSFQSNIRTYLASNASGVPPELVSIRVTNCRGNVTLDRNPEVKKLIRNLKNSGYLWWLASISILQNFQTDKKRTPIIRTKKIEKDDDDDETKPSAQQN